MAPVPQIILPDPGLHNRTLSEARARLIRGQSYRDCSTICLMPIHPGRAGVAPRVLSSWFSMMTPMNQKFSRMFLTNMEVGEAYSMAVEQILAHPELSTWKYILTLEDDNLPPPDGLLKLVESIEAGPYAAVGGLYWTKGEGGQPMIYGDPSELPRNYRPQLPVAETVQRCNGLGMGFTLFRLSMFKDAKLTRPWFKTKQEWTPGVGASAYTQDLFFFDKAGSLGYTFASDNRVKVGHYDQTGDMVW